MLASLLFNSKHMKLFFLALFAFLPIGVRAERLPIKTYTVADGLQRDYISRIRQDSRGFLWFCTAEGISRFDGAGMTNFTVADGLPDRFVNDFLETKNGTIYIATGKGLARLNPHGLRASKENPLFTVFLPDNARAEQIQILFEDRNNQVWAGTSDGLYRLTERDGRTALEVVPSVKPLVKVLLSVLSIIEDRRGALWIGTSGSGLFRLSPNGDVRRFTTADKLPDNNIASLLEDRDGQIWAGLRPGYEGGLCLLDAESSERLVKKCYSYKDGLPADWIPECCKRATAKCGWRLFRVCVSGKAKAENQFAKPTRQKNDLCDAVFSLAEDKDGNLWTGSECGVKKIARYGFTTYTEADGLDYSAVNSIFENQTGELFVSTSAISSKRAISRFNGDKFSLVKPPLPKYVGWGGWG